MKNLVAMLVAVAVSLAAVRPALGASVSYDFDPTVDFSEWESWAWKRPALGGRSSLAEDRIRRALEAGFAAEGYDRVDEPAQADFLIDYYAAAHRELRIDDRGPRWRRNVRVDTSPVGVLVVDVIDRDTGRLAWRGSVSDALASDPEEAEEAARKAVTKLLRKFPPSEDE